MRGIIRAIANVLIWPLSRFFDPRFRGIAAHVEAGREGAAHQAEVFHADLTKRLEAAAVEIAQTADRASVEASFSDLRAMLTADMEATSEATTVMGRSLADLLGEADRIVELIEELQGKRKSTEYVERIVGGQIEDLDEGLAKILNFANSHLGFAAQRNVWFNPALSLEYEHGGVKVSRVNERIAEGPYVMRAIAGLEPGASVLDVGAAESTLAFSLATLGYQVSALDLHPYPLEHPNLRAVQAPVQDWETKETFDAVVCLSTIEHIGIGAYGEGKTEDGADLEAMRRIHELTKPEGLLVLTAPFGYKGKDELQRTYDRPALDKLLEGWEVEDLTVLSQVDQTTWIPRNSSSPQGSEQVALVTARRA